METYQEKVKKLERERKERLITRASKEYELNLLMGSMGSNGRIVFKYVRDKRRQKIGVMVAIIRPTGVTVAMSKCNLKLDSFDPVEGKLNALTRAEELAGSDDLVVWGGTIPDSCRDQYFRFCAHTHLHWSIRHGKLRKVREEIKNRKN